MSEIKHTFIWLWPFAFPLLGKKLLSHVEQSLFLLSATNNPYSASGVRRAAETLTSQAGAVWEQPVMKVLGAKETMLRRPNVLSTTIRAVFIPDITS